MALFRTGCYVLKIMTPVLKNPGLMIPSSINFQVRHAARKGYREKKNRKRLTEKKRKLESISPKDQKQQSILKSKYVFIRKTVDQKKPEPPNDDIFIIDNFKHKKYTLAEAVLFHKEYHHPTVYNNPEAPITVRFDIDMTGKKETQVIKPFSGIAAIQHPFVIKQAKDVMVFCQPEDVTLCLDWGAAIAGGADLVKKIQEGIVLPSSYDHVVSHVNIFPELVPIRGLLKDKIPRANRGNLTRDLKSAVAKFLYGIEYSCVKFECDHNFGVISAEIGKVDMPVEHIEDNFKALVEDILTHRPSDERDFITWVWCFSPPSDESFALDLKKCLPEIKSKSVSEIRRVKKGTKPEEIKEEVEEKENEIEQKV